MDTFAAFDLFLKIMKGGQINRRSRSFPAVLLQECGWVASLAVSVPYFRDFHHHPHPRSFMSLCVFLFSSTPYIFTFCRMLFRHRGWKGLAARADVAFGGLVPDLSVPLLCGAWTFGCCVGLCPSLSPVTHRDSSPPPCREKPTGSKHPSFLPFPQNSLSVTGYYKLLLIQAQGLPHGKWVALPSRCITAWARFPSSPLPRGPWGHCGKLPSAPMTLESA